jgi:hypothetical protein
MAVLLVERRSQKLKFWGDSCFFFHVQLSTAHAGDSLKYALVIRSPTAFLPISSINIICIFSLNTMHNYGVHKMYGHTVPLSLIDFTNFPHDSR